MLSFFQARQLIVDTLSPVATEQVELLDSLGRAVAVDILADQPLPAFDNSAMDGYAVRAEDCGAGRSLPLAGYLPAGGESNEPLASGTAVKIMTGAALPAGANAVVPFEQTEEENNQVKISEKIREGDHIRWCGEDFQSGDPLVTAGMVVRPAEISLLASFGQTAVTTYRRLRVAILSSGDELQELGEKRIPGRIINSNSWALAAAVREIGAQPLMLGIARDDHDSMRTKIEAGLKADALITSAGVSVGDRDFVRDVLVQLGVRELFWKIAIKPGKPTAFGMCGAVPVFSLPGNPVSTMITFEEFVRPALLKMMGHGEVFKPLLTGRLLSSVKKKPGRLQLLRVIVASTPQGELTLISAGDQNTGIMRTMAAAQGIAYLSEEAGNFECGDIVPFHLLGAATGLGQ